MKYRIWKRCLAAWLCAVLAVLTLATPVAADEAVPALSDNVRVSSRFLELFFGKDKQPESGERYLCPGGQVFGIRLIQEGAVVSGVTEESMRDILAPGDVILSVNGETIASAADLRRRIQEVTGEVTLHLRRDGNEISVRLMPVEENGERRLGITVRDGTAGIGTVTFVDPGSRTFGGLGHGICEPESGKLIPMVRGEVTEVTLGGVTRGEAGKPGELHGVLRKPVTGRLAENGDCGVFGTFTTLPGELAAPVPVAAREEVHEGRATVISTVKNGERAEYEVQIRQIDYRSDGTKSFTVQVTDPVLLALTGGIVRGMSGSPILQDGKLIGALTHVMIADPTTGYGIFIENMLAAMPDELAPAA